MRKTGVYISVHTSNLANAPLLQPGSAVFEIIQVRAEGGLLEICRMQTLPAIYVWGVLLEDTLIYFILCLYNYL